MATRLHVPKALKQQLVNEAGGKCANPGCANRRTHIHHIQHWSVYKVHDGNHMIAICPSCHEAVHTSGISDETVYDWKQIKRNTQDLRDQLYIEPASDIRVLTGSMCITTSSDNGAVFRLSNSNHFTFRIVDGDLFLTNCLIKDLTDVILVRISENYITAKKEKSLTIERRPGRFSARILDAKKYLPLWASTIMWRALPDFVEGNTAKVLDIEVVRPGVVRLQGAFVASDAVFAVTASKIYVLRPEMNGPVAFVGQGEGTEIRLSGPITRAAFQL